MTTNYTTIAIGFSHIYYYTSLSCWLHVRSTALVIFLRNNILGFYQVYVP